ncbi:hypothetical protein PLICRDRAFT_701513 [Plicaturopsis crispa FD-325 SS-3]|uniref:Unplaced genomic scaffold PLICRscaffold_16, whole genome shotgun sequence n=1 Tax=Plicaturopsis crispa FD-325 SS-3 TaxID=944288 RepID=A0A0C9SRL0_PLICR|nr:hypothetical protein PLICRDRAFT_701513 [Plicaturopsis crispa FD-325 SS-3]
MSDKQSQHQGHTMPTRTADEASYSAANTEQQDPQPSSSPSDGSQPQVDGMNLVHDRRHRQQEIRHEIASMLVRGKTIDLQNDNAIRRMQEQLDRSTEMDQPHGESSPVSSRPGTPTDNEGPAPPSPRVLRPHDSTVWLSSSSPSAAAAASRTPASPSIPPSGRKRSRVGKFSTTDAPRGTQATHLPGRSSQGSVAGTRTSSNGAESDSGDGSSSASKRRRASASKKSVQ